MPVWRLFCFLCSASHLQKIRLSIQKNDTFAPLPYDGRGKNFLMNSEFRNSGEGEKCKTFRHPEALAEGSGEKLT